MWIENSCLAPFDGKEYNICRNFRKASRCGRDHRRSKNYRHFHEFLTCRQYGVNPRVQLSWLHTGLKASRLARSQDKKGSPYLRSGLPGLSRPTIHSATCGSSHVRSPSVCFGTMKAERAARRRPETSATSGRHCVFERVTEAQTCVPAARIHSFEARGQSTWPR